MVSRKYTFLPIKNQSDFESGTEPPFPMKARQYSDAYAPRSVNLSVGSFVSNQTLGYTIPYHNVHAQPLQKLTFFSQMRQYSLFLEACKMLINKTFGASHPHPFGMQIQSRSYTTPDKGYRFGFQMQEGDQEIISKGRIIEYKYRMHNTALCRFMSIDPLFRKFPGNSTYAFSENSVVAYIELEGLEKYYAADGAYMGQVGDNEEVRVTYMGDEANKSLITEQINAANNDQLDDNERLINRQLLLRYSHETYKSAEAAAISWCNEYHPKSLKKGIESGAAIHELQLINEDGTNGPVIALLTETIWGSEKSVDPKKMVGPTLLKGKQGEKTIDMPGTKYGFVHSHAKGSNDLSGFGLNGDMQTAKDYGIKVLMANKLGELKQFDPKTMHTKVISNDVPYFPGLFKNTESTKPAWFIEDVGKVKAYEPINWNKFEW